MPDALLTRLGGRLCALPPDPCEGCVDADVCEYECACPLVGDPGFGDPQDMRLECVESET